MLTVRASDYSTIASWNGELARYTRMYTGPEVKKVVVEQRSDEELMADVQNAKAGREQRLDAIKQIGSRLPLVIRNRYQKDISVLTLQDVDNDLQIMYWVRQFNKGQPFI